MQGFDDMDKLEEAVDAAASNIVLTSGLTLRVVGDESRLKANARDRIEEKLRGRGLVALPEVPWNQADPVYVTRVGSDTDKLHAALARPDEKNLARLHQIAGRTGVVVQKERVIAEAHELAAEVAQLLASINGH